MGNRHVAMPPAGFRALFRGGTWTKTINDLVTIWAGTNPIPICSQINNYDGDELWTSGPFVVDGLGVQLRGFRKSHHLIPASPDRSNGIAAGSHARDTRAPGGSRVYQQSAKVEVETACPCSKALSIPGTIRSRWSKTSPPTTTGRSNAPATTKSRSSPRANGPTT